MAEQDHKLDDVLERLRAVEAELAVTKNDQEHLKSDVKVLQSGISRVLWILGGGLLSAVAAWIAGGGLGK